MPVICFGFVVTFKESAAILYSRDLEENR